MTFDLPPIEHLRSAQGKSPRVSVIVPTYRARSTLLEAVRSVLSETWSDYEIIVVDDACPEDSTQVLASVADPRIRIIRLVRNVGLSGARNAGISVARGDSIALLDADDRSLPTRLQKQMRFLDSHPNVGLVAGLANKIDESGQLLLRAHDEWRLSDEGLKALLLFANPLCASSYLIRRSVLPEHGFRPIFSEDFGMTHDVMAMGHDIGLVREAVVDYRISTEGIMASKLDGVALGALSTQRRALDRVGLDVSVYDERLAREILYFGVTPASTMTPEWLLRVRNFLERVKSANQKTQVHSVQGLAEASARLWEMLLLESARRGGLRFGPRAMSLFGMFRTHVSSLRARAVIHSLANLVRRTAAR